MDAELEQKARDQALIDKIAYSLAAYEVWGGQLTPDEALRDEKMHEDCYARAEHIVDSLAEDLARALQAQPAEGGVPTEEQVEAAAKRMYSAWYGGEPPASFEVMDGYVPAKGYADRFRRMARAALAAPKPATTTGEGVGS